MLWPGILILLLYLIYRYSSQIRRRLPPGPKPLPLLGNIRDFPPPGVPEFQHWLKHKDQYGGISSVSALGMILIIMHDRKIVHDILEQASSKTPGRPRMIFANELCGYESLVLFQGTLLYFVGIGSYYTRSLGPKFRRHSFVILKNLR